MRILLLASGLALLAACSTPRPVDPTPPPPVASVAPPAGPHARVRFAAQAKMPVALFSYEDAACTRDERVWPVLSSIRSLVGPPPQRLGIALWTYEGRAATEHHVPAGVPMHGLFHVQDTHSDAVLSCGVAWSYRFEAGKDYEVLFSWADKSCRADVFEIGAGPGGTPVKRLQQHTTDTMSERAGTCRQLYRKRVLS